MRIRPLTALVVTATAGLLASSALAAPTALTVDQVSRAGTTVTASGTAAFDGFAPATSVGGAHTDFAQPAVSGAAGTDLKDALIETLPGGKGLRFTWKLASLPAQVPPEGVRYTWAFAIGDNQYQLQAKRTNLASVTTTEDPQGHASQAASQADWFQLRGACQSSYAGTPASGCYHLAFLKGAFDVAAGTVQMDLPWTPKDAIGRVVGADIVPGVTLMPNLTAGMSIAASFQAVVSNTTTSDFINGWEPYHAGPQVALGTNLSSAKPENVTYKSTASLGQGGTWVGSLSPVPAVHDQLFVRSCEGPSSTCTYTSVPLD